MAAAGPQALPHCDMHHPPKAAPLPPPQPGNSHAALRRTVMLVALLNLGYFFVEFFMARRIGSVSLLADSVDFLEDASVNLIIAFALGWSARSRARVGLLLAAVLLLPGLATLSSAPLAAGRHGRVHRWHRSGGPAREWRPR